MFKTYKVLIHFVMERDLGNTYYDPSLGLQGIQTFKKSKAGKRFPLKFLKAWSKTQAPITLHKQRRIRYRRLPYYSPTLSHTFQADLLDLSAHAKINRGFKFLLAVLDTFSRFVWIFPLKTKTGEEVTRAFQKLFRDGHIPLYLHVDQGSEFFNKNLKTLCAKYNVKMYATNSELKASMVERFIRTFKLRMWRYFRHRGETKYIDKLQALVENYNNSIHRTIGMSPAEVNFSNEAKLWKRLYGKKKIKKKIDIRVGDLVRVSLPPREFSKSYKGNWSEEIFVVSSIVKRELPVVTLKDRDGEKIRGIFYSDELQRVSEKTLPDDLYQVEKILRRKVTRGVKFALVKWTNYNRPSWVKETDIVTI